MTPHIFGFSRAPQEFLVVFGGYRVYLAHITVGRKKDPFYINIRNPKHPKIRV